jgi:rSAM/selenodomain-associated transferase 1
MTPLRIVLPVLDEGPGLLFLHADTQLPPDADRLIDDALAGGADWGRFDVRIDGPQPLLRVVERLMNLRSRLTGIATGDQAIFVRREAFERVGGFPPQLLMEDIELCRRLKRLGAPACIATPVRTSARRWQQGGVLRTIGLMWSLRLRYFLGADARQLAQRYGYRPAPAPVQAAVAILAKAPLPGLAKTRLIPALGAAGAARVQRRFACDALHAARQAQLGPVRLWCAPDAGQRFFRALARGQPLECHAQPEGDLGARLLQAMAQHFSTTPGLPLLLMGTDCPLLSPGHLQAAARALADLDAVMIPAEDGGYVLLGLRRPVPQAFQGIAWSTAAVAAQPQARLREAGASLCLLKPLWDVDEPADWHRLQRLLGGNGDTA